VCAAFGLRQLKRELDKHAFTRPSHNSNSGADTDCHSLADHKTR
jgi:hypothetical protein